MQLGKFNFVFGLGFLKALNKQNTRLANGIPIKIGLESMVPNLYDGDVDTLAEVLLLANRTEKPKATEADIEALIEEAEDIDALFNGVMEELAESNFTKKKVQRMLDLAKKK